MHYPHDVDGLAGDPKNHPIITLNKMTIGSAPGRILGYGRTSMGKTLESLNVFFKPLDEFGCAGWIVRGDMRPYHFHVALGCFRVFNPVFCGHA